MSFLIFLYNDLCSATDESQTVEPAVDNADDYHLMNGWSSVETNESGPIEYFFASDARFVQMSCFNFFIFPINLFCFDTWMNGLRRLS